MDLAAHSPHDKFAENFSEYVTTIMDSFAGRHPYETAKYFWNKLDVYKAIINSYFQPLKTSIPLLCLLFGYYLELYSSLERSVMLHLQRKTCYSIWPFPGPPTLKQSFYDV